MPSIFRPTSQLLCGLCMFRWLRSKEGIEASHWRENPGNLRPSTKRANFHWNLHVCCPRNVNEFFLMHEFFTCKLPHEFLSDIDLSSFYEYKHIIPKLMFEWWTLKKKAIESILLLVPMSRL